MAAHIGHDRRLRDFRRDELLQRLIVHEARTRTIRDLTGYTRHELATLRRRWMVPKETRHRGHVPKSFEALFRSPRLRSEAAALAVVWTIYGGGTRAALSGAGPDTPIDVGERLCSTFEAFRAIAPGASLNFGQLTLLAGGLGKRNALALGHCAACGGSTVIDLLGTMRRTCSHCQRGLFCAERPQEECAGADAPKRSDSGSGGQGSLF